MKKVNRKTCQWENVNGKSVIAEGCKICGNSLSRGIAHAVTVEFVEQWTGRCECGMSMLSEAFGGMALLVRPLDVLLKMNKLMNKYKMKRKVYICSLN